MPPHLQQSQQIVGAGSEVGAAARPVHLVSFSGLVPPDLLQGYLEAGHHLTAQSTSSRATAGRASPVINSSVLHAAFTGFDSSADLQGFLGSISHHLTAFVGIAHSYLRLPRAHQADQQLWICHLGVALGEPVVASSAQVHSWWAVPFAAAGTDALLTRDIMLPPLLAGLGSQLLAPLQPRATNAPSLAAAQQTGC